MKQAAGFLNVLKKGINGLTKREQVMIYGLVVIVIIAVLVFLIILPALTNLSELDSEVSELQNKKMEMEYAISQVDDFEERYVAAEKAFKSYKKQLFLPMDPESLDELVTSLLVDSGLTPKNLTMSPLQQAQLPAFAPTALQSQGTPQVGTDGALVENTDENTDESADGDVSGILTFMYTANVTTEGDRADLTRLIDNTNSTSGIEIAEYSYAEGSNDIIEGITTKGTVTATIYVYVYMDKATGETLPSVTE